MGEITAVDQLKDIVKDLDKEIAALTKACEVSDKEMNEARSKGDNKAFIVLFGGKHMVEIFLERLTTLRVRYNERLTLLNK